MALASILANAIRPEDVRSIRRAIPGYEENRERAAVLVAKGQAAEAFYQRNRKWIFTGALCGMGASGYALWKRYRIPEASVLYGSTFLLSSVVAWLTRPPAAPAGIVPGAAPTPGVVAPAPAPPVPTGTPGTPLPATETPKGGFVGWLDTERARRAKTDPQWADKTLTKAVGAGVVQPTWQSLPPYLQALVL
jgi:hypothetical protein